jgi:hypothetical protein
MATEMTVEQRVAILEKEVAELKQHLPRPHKPGTNWLDQVSGSLKDYPEFDEVLRFGHEIRQANVLPLL